MTGHVESRLRRRGLSNSSKRQVEQMLSSLERLAADQPRLNWHVHVSGHDDSGGVFWMPLFEDPLVVRSSAGRVLGTVYRFIESAESML